MALVTSTSPLDNRDETINSRDVIARIEDMQECIDAGEVPDDVDTRELAQLRDLAEDGEGFEDWVHGATLIRDTYFVEYTRDSFVDTSEPEVRESMNRWPFDCIDWERAARELQSDYCSVDFAGVTYWIR